MEGLSDENSDLELKDFGSAIGLNPDDTLIQPDYVTEGGLVEARGTATTNRKKVGFKTVGKAITAFLGVPEERKPADYDPQKFGTSRKETRWTNRRIRLAARAYGGLRQQDHTDDVDGQLPDIMPLRHKPSVWAYAKEGVYHLTHNWRRVSPAQTDQKSKSFRRDIQEVDVLDEKESGETEFFDDRKPEIVDHVDHQKVDVDTVDNRSQAASEAVGLDRIGRLALSDLADNTDRRELGMGIVGRVFNRRFKSSVRQHPVVRQQLDDFEDFRPYFTYWITTVQILVVILSLCWYGFAPVGIELSLTTDFVLTEKLIYEQVSFYQPSSFWLGPRAADLIHLGAKFSPCMRADKGISESIDKRRKDEAFNTGCCIRNDHSGCLQTTEDKCSKVLSTFVKWGPYKTGPEGRISGPVCGQDPRFCSAPASVPPNLWPDDISKWPICHVVPELPLGGPEHIDCRSTARPCCIGIHGRCELRNREYCDFVQGHFHPEATLCSQVSCMEDVCGMLPFVGETPDQFYRSWTSLFLHAGLVHLSVTVAVQIFLMRDLERMCGPLRLSLIYLGSGIIGNMASAIFVPFRAESGPAGSQFGLLAALVIEVVNVWPMLTSPWFAISKLMGIFFLLLLFGFLPWVDNYAHVFGFVSGLLLSLILMPFITFKQSGFFYSRNGRIFIISACSLLVASLFVTLMVVFYAVPVHECEACKYFSCIPFTNKFCAEQNIDFAIREDFLGF